MSSESKIRDDNYFMVSGWMLNRLGLKGTALHVFAIIYGFSQDGEGSFTGSLQYLSDFTNTTKRTVINVLNELVDKGYVTKTENFINGVKFNTYKTSSLVVKNFHRGSEEISPNNKDISKSLISKEKVKEVIDLYHSICISFPSVKVVSKARSKTILATLDAYGMEAMKTVFENAEASSFLKGENDRSWSAKFDWLLVEKNFVKVLEGNYADKPKKPARTEKIPSWMQGKPSGELGSAEMDAIKRVLSGDPP